MQLSILGYVDEAIEEELNECIHMYNAKLQYDVPPRRIFARKLLSLEYLRDEYDDTDIAQTFSFRYYELCRLVPLLFPGVYHISVKRKGHMTREEATLLVLARLTFSISKYTKLERVFGRDYSTLSAFFRQAIKTLLKLHRHRLEMSKISQYAYLVPRNKKAVLEKYRKLIGEDVDNLPGSFADASLMLDGSRQMIDTPDFFPDSFYSGYVAGHNQLTVAVASPCGLILGLTKFLVGKNNDAFVVSAESVNTHLAMMNAKAICDKAFATENFIAALPKENMTAYFEYSSEQFKAISGLRTNIEWAFGEVFEKFPYLQIKMKQRIYQTSPASVYLVAVLMANCLKCFRGSKATTFYGLKPLTVEEYLS
jgi:hypothetical protein